MIMSSFSLSRIHRALAGVALAAVALVHPGNVEAAWPQAFTNAEVIKSIATPNGDVVVAGHFSGEMQAGTLTLHATGLRDIFVARVDAGGRVLWAVRGGSPSLTELGSIALDEANNVYVVGSYYQSIALGGNQLASYGDLDGFVARVNADGQWSWARRVGGSGPDQVNDVVVLPGDSSQIPPVPNSLVVTGGYRASANFQGSNNDNSRALSAPGSAPLSDTFLANLTTDGNVWNWAVNRSGSGGNEQGQLLTLDADQRLHMVVRGGGIRTLIDQNFPAGASTSGWSISSSGEGTAHGINATHIALLRNKGIGDDQTIPGLAIRSGPVSMTRNGNFNGAGGPLQLQFQLYRGASVSSSFNFGAYLATGYWYLSEKPDAGENLVFEAYGSDGNWHVLKRFPGAGDAGEYFNLTGEDALILDRPELQHAGLRFRLRLLNGSGKYSHGELPPFGKIVEYYDWWHVAHVSARVIESNTRLLSVSNLRTGSPSFGPLKELGADSQINAIGTRRVGSVDQLYMVGRHGAAFNIPDTVNSSCQALPGAGGFVAVLPVVGNNYGCTRLIDTGKATPAALAVDDQQVYVAGSFRDSVQLNHLLQADDAGNTDAFVAALKQSDGTWAWATGGAENAGNPPAPMGGDGDDAAKAISLATGGQLYVGGRFQEFGRFGPIDELAAGGEQGGFLVKLGSDGRFAQPEAWPVGMPITPPPNAETRELTKQPEFFRGGQPVTAVGGEHPLFVWAKSPVASEGYRLIPLQSSAEIEVHWRVRDRELQDPARIVTSGAAVWPSEACGDNEVPGAEHSHACYQVHVVGAPVEAEPSEYRIFGEVIQPDAGSSGASLAAGIFNAPRSGYAVIQYLQGSSIDQTQYPTFVEVVRSSQYATTPGFQDDISAEIGKKITSTVHNQPGRTGWVINELAHYDGDGPDAAYNREARTGTIIPVNRYSLNRIQDAGRELAVAWYRRNGKGVYWASRAARYSPRHPYDPDRIVIASEQGSEAFGQALLSPANFPQARIYIQNDPDKPGFNPNDEHALMAPSSTGSGYDAVFALRSDFGGEQEPIAASDPYVLLKYFNNGTQEWNFKVYRVEATNPQYQRFHYSGTAGTTISPPYPVRLLPGCARSYAAEPALGEPRPPFFQDHKNQLWAKAAGQGAVHYFYPIQPGFFQDNNNDGVNDLNVGDCTPWLARLPESQGGSESDDAPIAVDYSIVWPENTPLLVAGETLLKPKNGLPDIYSQAAVEVVHDDNRDNNPQAGPTDTLAQLIDPLSPRWVRLAQLPEAVASEMRSDGLRDITGSSDGTRKMPASLGERMVYDPQNQRLTFHGVFSEQGAGDPKLLLNVMSKRERVLLKKLDGGDGTEEASFVGDCVTTGGCTWDQAIEALFRLTRNPNHIQNYCEHSGCDNPVTDIPVDALLMAYEEAPRCITGYTLVIGDGPDAEDVCSNGNEAQNMRPLPKGTLRPISVRGGGGALTAGASTGSGYMTLAFNNDPALGALPVSLEVIRVGCLDMGPGSQPRLAPYQGQINVISPPNIFDEQIVLRHSGDFGGNSDALQFEWYFHPDANGTPPMPLPDPASGQMNGWIQFPVPDPNGAVEISIEGANIQTLSDNWYLTRYQGLPACGNASGWSLWAGQPGSTPREPRAQLAEGWVKRVLARLNPFEARVQDFGQAETNNFASMLIQLGERYSGPVALNNDPDNLNSMGLIEAYTTVMRRALQLSADSTPPVDYGPANAAVLLVASRLVNFYTLLGNEAYADAQDPTIGIDTEGDTVNLNPSIFTFQNQLESPLDEELVLLRGRDDSHGPVAASPVYNRLFWNFTRNDGEVAYALSYGITDQNRDGVIDEYDARIMFPQGHGDAWGHYLTATKTYYNLLRHPFFSWNPQSEAVLVAGVPINVDYLDERQFAQTAVAKARAGAEIVDLTYRKAYTEDPNGQWQGYEDTRPERAWGLSEWGRRAGMGAYFDWVTVNAVLPEEDENPDHVGIQRIQRDTVSELDEMASYYRAIQGQVDKADAGLNPLGLARGVVPFDIDPWILERDHKTQFEQVWERAMKAVNNAFALWDHANQLNNQLRRNQDSVDALSRNATAQETDFANRLIEIFGYPYVDDIGPGGTYPSGYDGPDLYHYMYVDAPALAGTSLDFDTPVDDLQVTRIEEFTGYYGPDKNGMGFFDARPSMAPFSNVKADCQQFPMGEGCPLGDADPLDFLTVSYTTIDSPDYGFWFTKPPEWSGDRRAPGKLQQILHQMFMARISLKQAILEYDNLRLELEAQIDTVATVFDIKLEQMHIAQHQRSTLQALTAMTQIMNNGAIAARRVAAFIGTNFKEAKECVPDNMIVGLAGGGDLFSTVKCAVGTTGNAVAFAVDTVADVMNIAGNAIDASKEDVTQMDGINSMFLDANLEMYNTAGEVDALLRKEPGLRAELYARTEAIKQLQGDYNATLAEGLRVYGQLISFRRYGAADVQEYRYKDMAFRIFRNDALQKYRASFDLAARYVYLAASAYDYETNLLGSNNKAGQGFLTRIVKQRSLGQLLNGEPMAGSPGLADSMAQLAQNFDVLKGQMGFNNPNKEFRHFSLRHELFRVPPGAEGDAQWQHVLEAARVPDLWQVPEFRRMARPFAPRSAGPQPGLVLEFSTNVSFNLNFFGWDLGAGDSSYDSSRFATRIHSVGAAFGNYVNLPLANNPRVYLMPAGADVLRAADPDIFTVRDWQVLDQVIPMPFPVGSQDIARYDWNPGQTLDESSVAVRRFPQINAYPYEGDFDDEQVASDSRLVGRSVWNRRWLLIIPGATFGANPNEGLDTFIYGARVPGSGNERDGDGVDDIQIAFKTYSYTGN